MTKELIFKNLTIKYNTEQLSKSAIRKTTITEYIITILFFIIYFCVMVLNGELLGFEKHFALTIVIGIVLSGIFVFEIAFVLVYFHEKFTPRHYDFITWLMKYKSDEIEIGWLNDRYVVNMYGQHGWIKKELGHFINEDYKLEDKADKSKPVYMTIDLVNGDVEVIVKNQ